MKGFKSGLYGRMIVYFSFEKGRQGTVLLGHYIGPGSLSIVWSILRLQNRG